jgi:hypothetical protein
MTEHSKATPRPWRIYDMCLPARKRIEIHGYAEKPVAIIPQQERGKHYQPESTPITRDNAALIVEAVNNHDRLIEENKRLRDVLERIANYATAAWPDNRADATSLSGIARAALEG